MKRKTLFRKYFFFFLTHPVFPPAQEVTRGQEHTDLAYSLTLVIQTLCPQKTQFDTCPLHFMPTAPTSPTR